MSLFQILFMLVYCAGFGLAFGWYYGSWLAALIGFFWVIVGFMSIEYFGHMIPGISYLLAKRDEQNE
jgi:hypothetical protein